MERAIIANRKHDKGEVRKEMSERKMKRVEDSLTEQSHLLMPKCLNAAGYLFGGQPVSYTHLDVYKRQVRSCSTVCEAVFNCSTACLMINFVRSSFGSIETSSLDAS